MIIPCPICKYLPEDFTCRACDNTRIQVANPGVEWQKEQFCCCGDPNCKDGYKAEGLVTVTYLYGPPEFAGGG